MESLLVPVDPIAPECKVDAVRKLFLQESHRHFLCLPVVDDGYPIGSVSRDLLQRIFMSMYGRELYGHKPIEQFMNARPLVIEIDTPIEEASQYVSKNISYPVTEDFILTRQGLYLGVGHVVDLLKAMELRLARRTEEVALAYDKLKSSQAMLVESEKLSSLGRIVVGFAHELNTPLGNARLAVSTLTDVTAHLRAMITSGNLKKSAFLAQLDACVQSAAMVERNIVRAAELISTFKQLAVDQAVAMRRRFLLDEIASEVEITTRPLLKGKSVRLEVDFSVPNELNSYPGPLTQVITNLVQNAVIHGLEGRQDGVIKLSAKPCPDGPGEISLTVEDNGIGMTQEIAKRVFEPFFTTRLGQGGTGLGLHISYTIVTGHLGGRIEVDSSPGQGCRFHIRIPLVSPYVEPK